MLGSLSIDLGPFNLPVWLIAAAAGLVVALVIERTLLGSRRELFRQANDLLVTGLLWGFLLWKLSPLVTRFREVAEAPLRLLYYPGGTAGLIAGLVGAAAAMVVSRARAVRRVRHTGADPAVAVAHPPGKIALAVALTLACVLAPVALTRVVPVTPRGNLPDVTVDVLIPETPGVWSAAGTQSFRADARELAAGRPMVLVFWATWCGPCTAQMPEVQRVFERLGESAALFAVNLTATEPGEDAVRSYLDSNGLTFPVILDRADALRGGMQVRATPTNVVLDAAGNERARRTGAVAGSWIERRVLPLLR